MAIYQPTNITPSSFAGIGQGTVAGADNISVSWQVNGNSPLSRFQIDVYKNDAASTYVTSLGGIQDAGNFHGTDAKGNPVFYTFSPASTTWQSRGVTDGNDYKLKITQFYGMTTDTFPSVSITESTTCYKGTRYCFGNYDTADLFIEFTAPHTFTLNPGDILCYIGNNQTMYGGFDSGDTFRVIPSSGILSSSADEVVGGDYAEIEIPNIVMQNSASVFIARSAPTLTVAGLATHNKVSETFTATYEQAQGASVENVKWTLVNNTSEEIIAETPPINTGVLSLSYDGFLSGNNYTVTCTVVDENGVTTSADLTFDVQYTTPSSNVDLNISCSNDGSVLIDIPRATTIPGTASPITGYSISNGRLTVDEEATVSWNEIDGNPMSIPADYAIACKIEIPKRITTTELQDISSNFLSVVGVQYNRAKTKAVVYGAKTYYGAYKAILCNVADDGTLSYAADILYEYNTDEFPSYITAVCFSWNNSKLFVGCTYGDHTANVYDLSTEKASYEPDKVLDNGASPITEEVFSADFIDNEKIVICGNFTVTPKCFIAQKAPEGYYYVAESVGSYNSAPSLVKASSSGYIVTLENVGARLWYYNDSTERYVYVPLYDKTKSGHTIPFSRKMRSAHFSDNGMYIFLGGDPSADGNRILQSVCSTNVSYPTSYELPDGFPSVVSVCDAPQSKVLAIGSENGKTTGIAMIVTSTPSFAGSDGSTEAIYTDRASKISYIKNGDIYSFGHGKTFKSKINSIAAGNFCEITCENESVTLSKSFPFVSVGGENFVLPANADGCVVLLKKDSVKFVPFPIGKSEEIQHTFSALENPITSVTLYGENTFDYVYITRNTDFDIAGGNPSVQRDENTLFFADFVSGLQAGTYSASGSFGAALYQQNGSKAISFGRIPADVRQIKDYGIRSLHQYNYVMFYVDNDTYSAPISSAEYVCQRFDAYMLVEATEDAQNPNIFHVLRSWRFGNNIEAGSVTNGNAPNLLENFTRYPLRQPTSQSPHSGTLTALLSNAKNNTYADNAEQMAALDAISHSGNTFFLRDMKGNMYNVHTSAAITQTINTRTAPQEVTVSIPWVEVGSAEGIAIIQLPTDPGWNGNTDYNDNGTIKTQEKSVSITQNGNTSVTPDNGFFLKKVNISVDVPLPETPNMFYQRITLPNDVNNATPFTIQHNLGVTPISVFISTVDIPSAPLATGIMLSMREQFDKTGAAVNGNGARYSTTGAINNTSTNATSLVATDTEISFMALGAYVWSKDYDIYVVAIG